ncbi:hypothetical protein [Sphingobium sp. Z007]|uniref:hypothetical protein n=1 Tax=Sphingobium sp. Z007 TaxID=627495 RepID=UPI000B4A4916|nr:hypothetical protein [Sphingobium sp. Z007]
MSDEPHITYYGMGAWPIYVGFTTSEKAFKKEMKRLNVSPPPNFLGSATANATTHMLEKGDALTCVITMQKPGKERPVEQLAGLLAHEAVHVAQALWRSIGERDPGDEAEAYLVQMITQCCMQDALGTGRCRSERP